MQAHFGTLFTQMPHGSRISCHELWLLGSVSIVSVSLLPSCWTASMTTPAWQSSFHASKTSDRFRSWTSMWPWPACSWPSIASAGNSKPQCFLVPFSRFLPSSALPGIRTRNQKEICRLSTYSTGFRESCSRNSHKYSGENGQESEGNSEFCRNFPRKMELSNVWHLHPPFFMSCAVCRVPCVVPNYEQDQDY